MVAVAEAVDEPAAPRRSWALKRPARATLLEILLVLASPVVLFFVLRLRGMAPGGMPDPAMHTTYVIDPRDFFARFTSELASTSGTREGARVGFLVPARLAYLGFGAVRGFFVFRYVLALVAVAPAYVLLRRLYGRAAGAVAIVILMSSPVLITAWGTDYPDSAVVSYLTGALACLAMPCKEKRQTAWLAIAASLFTLAVWSNVSAAPLVVVTMVVYLGLCFARTRRRLLHDTLVLGASAGVVTVVMMLASGLLLGPFDYIIPTFKAYSYLNRPSVVHNYHSTNRFWILLRPYLLVPLAAMGVWGATFGRRLRAIPTPQLLIGLACAAQIAIFSWLQLLGDAETLEQHYYSSSLWAAICLVLAITVSALAKPLLDHFRARFIPVAIVLAIPLIYETDPHLPAFGWLPVGLLLVAAMAAVAGIGRGVVPKLAPVTARVTAAAIVVVLLGGSLILTTAPYQHHAPLQGVIDDPVPAYAGALGGSDTKLVDQYRVAADLPQFVGNSTYPSERLLMWFPIAEDKALAQIIGIYHANFDSFTSSPPDLTAADRALLLQRRPAEILVFNVANFPATLRALSAYDPTLLRKTVLTSGSYALHAWLISLGAYLHASQS